LADKRLAERGIDTPRLVLLKVTAERIHYWDGGEEGEIEVAAGREAVGA
jgi:general stress protein 26